MNNIYSNRVQRLTDSSWQSLTEASFSSLSFVCIIFKKKEKINKMTAPKHESLQPSPTKIRENTVMLQVSWPYLIRTLLNSYVCAQRSWTSADPCVLADMTVMLIMFADIVTEAKKPHSTPYTQKAFFCCCFCPRRECHWRAKKLERSEILYKLLRFQHSWESTQT